jgi:SAM-dependent methyltransferase
MSDTCRSCGGTELTTFLQLGDLPLPDRFLLPEQLDDVEPQYPLDVAFCHDCTLVQLVGHVSAEEMFAEKYLYFSSFSDKVLQHSADHVAGLVASRDLGEDDLVVELASNDGYLLRHVQAAGVGALGIDPAPEPVAAARELGIPTLQEFFGRDVAQRLVDEGRRADVIIANNVMAHVPDLDDFVGGIEVLLVDDGLVTVENPYVRDLVEHGEFDTIYHEHVCYYSCTAIDNLVRPHGLHLQHVEEFPDLHGGTLRWHLGRSPERSATAEAFLAEEQEKGITEIGYYEGFADRVDRMRRDLREALERHRDQGDRVAAYGAAAKGTVMLNVCDLGTDLVEYVVDRNVHKHGHLMPGTHQPIRPVDALLEDRPDVVVLLAWNFTDEIVQQQQAYLDAGGRFLRPVPELEMIG